MAERLLILLRAALLHTRFSLSLYLQSLSFILPFFSSSIPNRSLLCLFMLFLSSCCPSFFFPLFLLLYEPKHRQTSLVLPPLVPLCLVFDTLSNDHNLSLLLHYFLRPPFPPVLSLLLLVLPPYYLSFYPFSFPLFPCCKVRMSDLGFLQPKSWLSSFLFLLLSKYHSFHHNADSIGICAAHLFTSLYPLSHLTQQPLFLPF